MGGRGKTGEEARREEAVLHGFRRGLSQGRMRTRNTIVEDLDWENWASRERKLAFVGVLDGLSVGTVFGRGDWGQARNGCEVIKSVAGCPREEMTG